MKPPYILAIVRGSAAYIYEEGERNLATLESKGRISFRKFNSLAEMNSFSLGFELGQRDPQAVLADDMN